FLEVREDRFSSSGCERLQWEFACRAGTTTPFYFGETISTEQVNYNGKGVYGNGKAGVNRQKSTPVGSFPANAFGLHDMHGNVWQWCQDWYGNYPQTDVIDPQGPDAGSHRILRGDSWMAFPASCRSACRGYHFPGGNRNVVFGFRVALTVETGTAAGTAEKTPSDKKAAAPIIWPKDGPQPAIAPFDAEQAKQHQEAWAKHLGVPVEYTNSLGMKFRLIPPGEFMMGSTQTEVEETLGSLAGDVDDQSRKGAIRSEMPRHQVILTRPFYLGIHEVTQKDYETIQGKNPSSLSPAGQFQKEVLGMDTKLFPVESVRWSEAVEFCTKLSQREGHAEDSYRLPTEAEWEYACRAGTQTRFWFGDSDADINLAAWCFPISQQKRTTNVGTLRANPFGLFDVCGNVAEWCHDWSHADSYRQFENQLAIDPLGPVETTGRRLARGGYFFWTARACRSSDRTYSTTRDHQWADIGFRPVLSVEAVRKVIEKPADAAQAVSPLASLKDSAAVLMYLNDPKNNRGGSVPVALLGREGRVAFRFGNWLVVFEGVACDPKAGILGFSNFNIPQRGSSGEGTVDFGAGDKLPGVLIKFKLDGEQNELSINNNRFKLRGKATRLEFDDRSYDSTNALQTILVARDGTTRLEPAPAIKPTPAVQTGVNVISDPSFEDSPQKQLPPGWSPWFNEGPKSRWEIVDGGHTGKRSLKLIAEGTRAVVFANNVPLDRSKRYALKGWTKFEGPKDSRAIIKFNYFHNGKWLGVHDLVGVTTDQSGWHQLEKTDAADSYPEATLLVPTCHVEGEGTAWFDDLELIAFDRDKLPANFEATHGKNNRLVASLDFDRWVGEWDATFEVKPNAQSPQGSNTRGTMTTRKVLDDRFLLTHSANESDPTQWMWFLTHDANLAAYRIWIFGSGGEAFERRGQWDAASQMLTLQLVPPSPGVTGQSTDRFISNDQIESTLLVKSADGQVTRDNRWSAKRKSPQPKTLPDIPSVAAPTPQPEELSLLNKHAGEWTIRAKYKQSVWNPQPREETITEKSVWILGGRFLMTRAFNENGELTSIWLATYEPKEKSNHAWFFSADGSSGQWRITWDEASRGFHWRAIDMPPGWIGTGFNRWINDDTFDNQALIKDESGRVLLDGTQDKRRMK
ncbi:MAG: SUMF1/EgtB/PvdO family nonheme iron enzyme, partial [Planctomycetota bacterium]